MVYPLDLQTLESLVSLKCCCSSSVFGGWEWDGVGCFSCHAWLFVSWKQDCVKRTDESLCLTAPGSHPVPGGVFPPPPAAAALLQLLPPPQCFNVSQLMQLLSEGIRLIFFFSVFLLLLLESLSMSWFYRNRRLLTTIMCPSINPDNKLCIPSRFSYVEVKI